MQNLVEKKEHDNIFTKLDEQRVQYQYSDSEKNIYLDKKNCNIVSQVEQGMQNVVEEEKYGDMFTKIDEQQK